MLTFKCRKCGTILAQVACFNNVFIVKSYNYCTARKDIYSAIHLIKNTLKECPICGRKLNYERKRIEVK
ncbi:MAG: hypothetical protein QW599_05440 [Nitrososphaerota archaeon]